MTIALIILAVFLFVWITDSSEKKNKKNKLTKHYSITNEGLVPLESPKFEVEVFNKWYKHILNKISNLNLSEDAFLFDVIDGFYKEYNVPNYTPSDHWLTAEKIQKMRRLYALTCENFQPKFYMQYGDKINIEIYAFPKGQHSNDLAFTTDAFISPSLNGFDEPYDDNGIMSDKFIRLLQERGRNNESTMVQCQYIDTHIVEYVCNSIICHRYKSECQEVINTFTGDVIEKHKQWKKYIVEHQPKISLSERIFLLPETYSYFLDLIHELTRKELKQRGYLYRFRGKCISQRLKHRGEIYNIIDREWELQPLEANKHNDADDITLNYDDRMESIRRYLEEYPWDY